MFTFGFVEKKEPGEFRMIHHLSYPENQFFNDGIPTDKSFVQYSSISDAIQLVKQCGKCLLCCKTDIKSAFRIINTCIHQSQYKLFGFKWKNKYYFDTCLQFGFSSSCRIFERFLKAL